MVVLGSSTVAFATSAEAVLAEEEERGQESMGQIMEHVIRTRPDVDEIVAWLRNAMNTRDATENDVRYTFPDYDELSWYFMRTAYKWMFRLYPDANWMDTMIYSWGVARWGGSSREEFAKQEGLTESHALGFWYWRQELLCQAGEIMNDPQKVIDFYDKYKKTVVELNRWHNRSALKRARLLLSVIQGTHELCPYLTVVWYAELRDGEYYGLYGEWKNLYTNMDYDQLREAEKVKEWFYFLERRRAVGGDDVIIAYEMIVADFIKTMQLL